MPMPWLISFASLTRLLYVRSRRLPKGHVWLVVLDLSVWLTCSFSRKQPTSRADDTPRIEGRYSQVDSTTTTGGLDRASRQALHTVVLPSRRRQAEGQQSRHQSVGNHTASRSPNARPFHDTHLVLCLQGHGTVTNTCLGTTYYYL